MRRDCPPEFQDRIDATFGTNHYGEPIFKLVWCQTALQRAGGYWQTTGFRGYRDMPAAGKTPCWGIFMWEPAKKFGSPNLWYYMHRDPATGLQDLGEYPFHGRYRLIHKLVHRYLDEHGKLHLEAMDLNSMIIESILPIVKAWQSLEPEKQVAYLTFDMAARDEEIAKAAAEAKRTYAPAFKGGAVSFTGQGCRTSLIAKKEEFLERNWRQLMAAASRYRKGMNQVSSL